MELSLLTFNIRYDIGQDGPNGWAHRQDLVLDLVRAANADIVAFQESLPHQRRDLEEGLPGYRFHGRGREHDGAGESCTIAVKPDFQTLEEETFWLSPTPSLPGSVGWDAMLTRICTRLKLRKDGRELSIFNAHFDHHGKLAPEKSAALILESMAAIDHPHALVGDFNSTPSSKALSVLSERLRDSFAEMNPNEETGTYHEFGALAHPTRIDYLMMSPHWRTTECHILAQPDGPYPSDHFPVLGRFEL